MNFDRSALKDKRLVEAGKKAEREFHSKEENFLVKREFSQRLFAERMLGESGIASEKKFSLSPSFLFIQSRPNGSLTVVAGALFV